MGLFTLTHLYSPFAMSKGMVRRTNIFTALRSAAGPGGVFDAPRQKCPPDGGSSVCVTGKPAHLSPIFTELGTAGSYFQPRPRPVPPTSNSRVPISIPTPPLSPDDGSTVSSLSSIGSLDWKSAPEFLITLFPRAAFRVSPYAKAVSVSGEGRTFDGFVLDLPPGFGGSNPKAAVTRTLFVDGKGADIVQLRESLVAMLDLADEHLSCKAVVIALHKSNPAFGNLVHSLMYAGGTFVTQPPFEVNPSFALLGIEV